MTDAHMRALAGLIRPILERPLDDDRVWTIHGLGMMRTYLDGNQRFRLHIWHDTLQVQNIADSEKHTHPWDFTSMVFAGLVRNHRFDETMGWGPEYDRMSVMCGLGACSPSVPVRTRLAPHSVETYGPGNSYYQDHAEIHYTEFTNGTVTLIQRSPVQNDGTAEVFIPAGKTWVDAYSITARPAEIKAYTAFALDEFNKSWSPE